MPSRKNRIERLEFQIKQLKTELDKQQIGVKEYLLASAKLFDQNKKLIALLNQLQPIVGKLIAGYIILQKKGLMANEDYERITKEDAESFVAQAHSAPAQQVQDQSAGARPMENNPGDSGTGISGAESVRESVPAPKADEQPTEGTVADGLQGVRASSSGDDKSAPTSPVTPSNGSA